MLKKKGKDGNLNPKKIFWIATIVVFVICTAYIILMYCIFPSDSEKRGQFGDMFGFIGALFSGLAFAGLIVTMLQQREDLQNQKDEIQLQRKDLEAQTAALQLQKEEIAQTNKELKEQNKTIMLQRFENTFFNMLDFQMRIYNQVAIETKEGVKTGDAAFEFVFIKYRSKVLQDEKHINTYIPEIDSYNRHLTQILMIVDQTEYLSKKDKNYYIGLLSAHMTYNELVMFFYYCLTSYGEKTAKSLVETYALFREFGKKAVFVSSHLSLFEEGAFVVKD